MKKELDSSNRIIKKDVKELVSSADVLIENTISNINYELINLYWSIGKLVNDYKEENDSSYGDSVVKRFSEELSIKHGKGFYHRNIERMCLFNKIFRNTTLGSQSNNEKLNLGSNFKNTKWSHIRELLKFKDIMTINFYLDEVENKNLTKEELIRFIKSKSFERTISNQRLGKSKNEIERTLKDPIILNIDNKKRSEEELEKEILNNISRFKKEIGNHVMFYESQYKMNMNSLTHRVDLVFFDNDINSYNLVDLKINKVTNHDISQMQGYINYFNKHMKKDKFNNTIGIILCETKDARVFENKNIYQVKYLNEIPKDKELLKIINDNKVILLKTEKLKITNEQTNEQM